MQTLSRGSGVASAAGGRVTSRTRMQRLVRWLRRDNAIAILVLTPSLVAVAVFIYSFIVWTFYVSATAWNSAVLDLSFVGLEHWEGLLTDQRWLQDVRNMALYALGFMSQCIVIGFLLASLL